MYELFSLHAYAMAGEVDFFLGDQGGIRETRAVQCIPGSTVHRYRPWQYSGTRSFEKHSIMGLTAIRVNSD